MPIRREPGERILLNFLVTRAVQLRLKGELLERVREDAEATSLLFAMVREQSGGDLLRDILKWIVENPEEFAALLKMIVNLFAGGA